MKILKKIFSFRETTLLLITLLFIIILAILRPAFLNPINIFGILYSVSVNAMIVGAMTVLFVSGGFDMAVGSVLGVSGTIVAMLMKNGMPIPVAILITIILGMIIGSIMGYFVSYAGINPFIVTLSGWFVYGSLVYLVGGGNVSGFPKSFGLLASYKLLNVPMIIIFAIVIIVIFEILLRKNLFIRQSFYIGSNEMAAELVGIKVRKVKFILYVLTSSMAAIAGIFLTSRFQAAYSTAGSENAFQIITAVIIGGASLKGGKGSVRGSIIALIFVALIYDALVLFEVNLLWNKILIGSILIIAVFIDGNIQKRAGMIRV